MATRMPCAVSLLLALLLSSGCATMVKGRTQIIDVRSSPTGASVKIQPLGMETPRALTETLSTPCKIVLSRKLSYVVRIEKSGYEPASVALESKFSSSMWRNAVWLHPVAIGAAVIVDVSTGSGYEFEPGDVDVTLSPTPEGGGSTNSTATPGDVVVVGVPRD